MNFSGYDIIGDVHGCANTLKQLLEKLEYRFDDGVYWHPSRQAIFVGDVIDRGPHIREAVNIVKNMVENGSAQCILGNHEFNALAYTTPVRDDSEEVVYVRPHSGRNNRLIAETLVQYASYPNEWNALLNWLKTLPLFIDNSHFRVVHACWDEKLIRQCQGMFQSLSLNSEFIKNTVDTVSFEYQLVDRLTRGTSIRLPGKMEIRSKDGFRRNFFRTKFWSENPKTYMDVVFQPDPLPEHLMNQALSDDEKRALIFYDHTQPPVFIGHYWLQGVPKPLKENVACLDYSAVKYGRLVAYRYDGEGLLDKDKFYWVYVDPDVTN